MSTDLVLRTVGTLACIYAVGLFTSLLSMSALNAASNAAGSPCAGAGCHVAYQLPHDQLGAGEQRLVQAAAIFMPGNF
jgi:hypothetical protein